MQTANASAFVGAVPENYDAHLGPMFFAPNAKDMAERAAKLQPAKILELAAGTGIGTEQLCALLPNAEITATDLNAAMIDRANAVRPNLKANWRQADAQALDFEDNTFDLVVASFGVMFYPDKPKSFEEAYRVLKPGGTYLFNVWDSLAKNDVSRSAEEVLNQAYPNDPPKFLHTPYGFSDVAPWKEMAEAAGFVVSEPAYVPNECNSISARSAASGIILGTPASAQIQERNGNAEDIRDRLEAVLAERYGNAPMSARMASIVFQAQKPA